MSSQPFDLQPVIERLTAAVPELQTVEGAAQYAAITGLKDFRPPCAYVLLIRERADQEQPKAGRQRALVTFGVVVVARNYRDQRGAEMKQTLDPLLSAVRNSLIGWTPDGAGARPVKWLQGDVLDYDANTLLWSDVFETQHFMGAGS